MVQQERLMNIFFEYVQIDSETRHEAEVVRFLKEQWKESGLHVLEDDAASKTDHQAGNVIITWPATKGYEDVPTIFFTSHVDTVVPGNGIKPYLDTDGYIKSDGTTILGADDKAGLAAMREAFLAIEEQQVSHGQIQFVFTVGEEAGLNGAKVLAPELLKAKYGFALDSNGPVGDIIVAAPTQSKLKFEFFGRAAHAGVNPEAGISAIQVASKAISAMKLGRIDAESTANIGRFSGGGPTNIVCDYAMLDAEARSLRADRLAEIVRQMRETATRVAEEFGAQAKVSDEVMYPAFSLGENDYVVQIAQKAAVQIGRTPQLLHSGGGSDANVFNGFGVPTVNLGVGYEEIHTTSEKIPLLELTKVAELVVAIIQVTANENRH